MRRAGCPWGEEGPAVPRSKDGEGGGDGRAHLASCAWVVLQRWLPPWTALTAGVGCNAARVAGAGCPQCTPSSVRCSGRVQWPVSVAMGCGAPCPMGWVSNCAQLRAEGLAGTSPELARAPGLTHGIAVQSLAASAPGHAGPAWHLHLTWLHFLVSLS